MGKEVEETVDESLIVGAEKERLSGNDFDTLVGVESPLSISKKTLKKTESKHYKRTQKITLTIKISMIEA